MEEMDELQDLITEYIDRAKYSGHTYGKSLVEILEEIEADLDIAREKLQEEVESFEEGRCADDINNKIYKEIKDLEKDTYTKEDVEDILRDLIISEY